MVVVVVKMVMVMVVMVMVVVIVIVTVDDNYAAGDDGNGLWTNTRVFYWQLLLHLVMNQPVLFRNAVPKVSERLMSNLPRAHTLTHSQKLSRKLKLPRLIEVFGDREIEIGFTPYPLMHGAVTVKQTFGEYVRNATSFQRKYQHQYSSSINLTEADVHEREVPLYVFLPDFFDDEDLVKVALELGAVSPDVALGLDMHVVQLLMGPAGSGAPPHFHRSALNFVIKGNMALNPLWLSRRTSMLILKRHYI